MTPPRKEYRTDYCDECHGLRSRELTRERDVTRFEVLLPSRCPHKDRCCREIMAGYEYDLSRPWDC